MELSIWQSLKPLFLLSTLTWHPPANTALQFPLSFSISSSPAPWQPLLWQQQHLQPRAARPTWAERRAGGGSGATCMRFVSVDHHYSVSFITNIISVISNSGPTAASCTLRLESLQEGILGKKWVILETKAFRVICINGVRKVWWKTTLVSWIMKCEVL